MHHKVSLAQAHYLKLGITLLVALSIQVSPSWTDSWNVKSGPWHAETETCQNIWLFCVYPSRSEFSKKYVDIHLNAHLWNTLKRISLLTKLVNFSWHLLVKDIKFRTFESGFWLPLTLQYTKYNSGWTVNNFWFSHIKIWYNYLRDNNRLELLSSYCSPTFGQIFIHPVT